MADGMREKTTNVGGVIKRIWYAMTGATQGAELASLDDTGKLKCVSEQITGLAGTGNRMVVADASGSLSASGEVTEMIKAKGDILVNASDYTGNGSSAYIRSLNDYSTPTNPDYTFWFNIQTGIYHPSAHNLGISTEGVSRALFNSSGLTLPKLAGAGNRMVVANSSGNLSATDKFRVNTIPLINTLEAPNVALMSNHDISFHWTSNTSLRITMKGSDGVMRSTILTLS